MADDPVLSALDNVRDALLLNVELGTRALEKIERLMARREAGEPWTVIVPTEDKPLAWIRLETNRKTFKHELSVRYWPGGGEDWALLAEAHPHGAWVEWRGA